MKPGEIVSSSESHETASQDMTEARQFSGASGPDRYLSALFDQVFAFITAFVVAVSFGDDRRDSWAGVAAVAAYVLYFLLGEGLFTTPGKAMFELRVVTLDGRPCGLARATVRTLTRLVEVNPVVLGGLPAGALIVLTPRHQRLGDIIARTVVARTSELNPISGCDGTS